ncbi:hypothetical protein IFM89_011663 [Coptis chinensis]|uniref:40S ribosomal protein S12 n=1 Tax=Coptis chinensis TaxID=261450 RepID=A0A835HQ82_9MAGN|nr:hypothetical protein IFM89_011663 [Coptis chinensis]
MDIMTALQLALKKSLAHDGLARGIHEGAKVIEKHAAQLCVVAEDCNQPDYVKLDKYMSSTSSTSTDTSDKEWEVAELIATEAII